MYFLVSVFLQHPSPRLLPIGCSLVGAGRPDGPVSADLLICTDCCWDSKRDSGGEPFSPCLVVTSMPALERRLWPGQVATAGCIPGLEEREGPELELLLHWCALC